MDAYRQLFDTTSSTYTYLLVDPSSRHAVIIDPVDTHLDDYLELIAQEGLILDYVIETHAHADHVTSSGRLCQSTGAKAAAPVHCEILPADVQLEHGAEIHFGGERLRAVHTPGHTAGSMSYLWRDRAFTGDALLIGGCGRTDFQDGDAGALYDSITGRLFTLPDGTIVCPAHDYHGKTQSTIGEERRTNPRLAGKSRAEFIDIMASLQLPKPSAIDAVVAANRRLGLDVQQA